ncbi:MAG: SEC-C metal-binding domain-containing protein, partial [Deltaproteobacteria bacterium]|nr:SEC-C metal-binding domain-containing protein [Deltaproteobacteria bacterium]
MGRNDPCPCGSGLKYKKCCLGKSKIQHQSVKKIYAQKYNIRLKEKGEIQKIKR